MEYLADDKVAEYFYGNDITFFEQIRDSFYAWEENSHEKRIPQEFNFRHYMGNVDEEE